MALIDLRTGLRVTVEQGRKGRDEFITITLEIPRICRCQLSVSSNGHYVAELTNRVNEPPPRKFDWFDVDGEGKLRLLKANLLCKRYVGMTFAEAMRAFEDYDQRRTVADMKGRL